MNYLVSSLLRSHVVSMIVALCVISSVGFSRAAEFGRTTIDGKIIILDTDGTWKQAPAGASSGQDCINVKSAKLPVTYCLDDRIWSKIGAQGAFEQLYNLKASEIYGGLIAEKTYIPIDNLRKIIISNAESKASLKGVNVVRDFTSDFQGQNWKGVEFSLNTSGVDLRYIVLFNSSNSIGTAQFVFFTAESNAANLSDVVKKFWIKFD